MQSDIFAGSVRSKKGCDPQIPHFIYGLTITICRLVYISIKPLKRLELAFGGWLLIRTL
jgi:hypothetical protein